MDDRREFADGKAGCLPPSGQIPLGDVEACAQFYVREILDHGSIDEHSASLVFSYCYDPDALVDRINELFAEAYSKSQPLVVLSEQPLM